MWEKEEIFRFNDSTCDVFIMNGEYLYAESAGDDKVRCRYYHTGKSKWKADDYINISEGWLHVMSHAPNEVARDIIESEFITAHNRMCKNHKKIARRDLVWNGHDLKSTK